MKQRIILIGLVLLYSGCATMIRGTREDLQISSSPEGATAQLSDGEACTTPCVVNLKRETSLAITLSKDGCDSQTISVFPTLAGGGVLLGGIIDYGDGAVYALQPNPVMAGCQCQGP